MRYQRRPVFRHRGIFTRIHAAVEDSEQALFLARRAQFPVQALAAVYAPGGIADAENFLGISRRYRVYRVGEANRARRRVPGAAAAAMASRAGRDPGLLPGAAVPAFRQRYAGRRAAGDCNDLLVAGPLCARKYRLPETRGWGRDLDRIRPAFRPAPAPCRQAKRNARRRVDRPSNRRVIRQGMSRSINLDKFEWLICVCEDAGCASTGERAAGRSGPAPRRAKDSGRRP